MSHFIYKCSECGREFDRDAVRYLCPNCGPQWRPGEPLRGVLEAVFDSEQIRKQFDPKRPDWSLFCAVEPKYHPPFPVGNTPLLRVDRLGEMLGFTNLFVKNDGLNPSGSLKDRASELMVAEAIRLGEERVVTASTGNAAAALAAACAAAGKKAVIFVPETSPKPKLAQMILYGADVIRVKGTYDDAFKLSISYTDKRGGLNRNTAYHPLTIEGKKTAALEIYEQMGCKAPAAVVVPVGDGVILAAIHKGFRDLREAGVINELPRLICVQAESSDAIHHYFTSGSYRNATAPTTIADSIRVSAPSNARLAKKALEESHGVSVLVSDDEIRRAQRALACTTGIFAEPAAAAAVAGLEKVDQRKLDRTQQVVLLITGHGLKDIETALSRVTLPEPVEPTLDAIPQ
ncbi:threonine synthase [candidate division KSB1 bacterium]|nr:MAG: threonine synthase [candidate division KSB1 bacterium]